MSKNDSSVYFFYWLWVSIWDEGDESRNHEQIGLWITMGYGTTGRRLICTAFLARATDEWKTAHTDYISSLKD